MPESLLSRILKRILEPREKLVQVGNIMVGNMPRENCPHCKDKLNYLFTDTGDPKQRYSVPRRVSICPSCDFIYHLPVR